MNVVLGELPSWSPHPVGRLGAHAGAPTLIGVGRMG